MAEASCRHLPAPGLPPGWGRSWLMLLLAAHTWSPFLHVTAAAAVEHVTITVNAVPPFPLEGQEVTLVPDGIKIGSVSCLWYRGEGVKNFPLLFIQLQPTPEARPLLASDGRQTAASDCSMRIEKLAFSDTGIYGVHKNRTKFVESGEVFLMVTAKHKLPSSKKSKPLTSGHIAAITIGCLTAAMFVVGLISLKTMGYMQRSPEVPVQTGSHHSAVRIEEQQEENEPKLSAHSIAAEEAPAV